MVVTSIASTETFHVKILYPTIIIELSTYILCNMILEDVPLNVIKTNPLPANNY